MREIRSLLRKIEEQKRGKEGKEEEKQTSLVVWNNSSFWLIFDLLSRVVAQAGFYAGIAFHSTQVKVSFPSFAENAGIETDRPFWGKRLR